MLGIIRRRGSLAIVGTKVNDIGIQFSTKTDTVWAQNRRERDGADYHITVVDPTEQCLDFEKYSIEGDIDISEVGTGMVENDKSKSNFVVIYSVWANTFRAMLGLPAKVFHLTLGFSSTDVHDQSKEFWSIEEFQPISRLSVIANLICAHHLKVITSFERNLLNHVAYHLMESSHAEQDNFKTLRMIGQRLANIPEHADVAFRTGFHLFEKGLLCGLKILVQVGRQPSGRPIDFSGFLPKTIESKGRDRFTERKLLRSINLTAETVNGKHSKVFGMEKSKNSLDIFPLPRNFSWVRCGPGEGETVSTLRRVHSGISSCLLAGSALPTTPDHIFALYGVGISTIITLHEEPLSETLLSAASTTGITARHFHVIDRTPPSLPQLREICDCIRQAHLQDAGVLVHCQGGVGRTNIAIMAYLVHAHMVSAAEAMQQVEAQRRVLVTESQIAMLKKWWTISVVENAYAVDKMERQTEVAVLPSGAYSSSSLTSALVWASHNAELSERAGEAETQPSSDSGCTVKPERGSMATLSSADLKPSLPIAPAASLALSESRQHIAALTLPPVIMLCGFAASGKSTFSKALLAANPDCFVRINKDDMRGKGQCEEALHSALRGGGSKASSGAYSIVLLDCCNLTVAKRKEWLDMTFRARAWCIFFDIPIEVCKYRIRRREGHPTIPPGEAGIAVLNSMERQLQPPTKAEGFEKIISIESEEQALALLADWHVPLTCVDIPTPLECAGPPSAAGGLAFEDDDLRVLKFPKIPHAVNLGAATRDDKIASTSDLHLIFDTRGGQRSDRKVYIEEKIDGANMGIFINKEGKIIAQNRSHFISSSYHPQFSTLDKWIARHSADLWEILEPGRHILFGEWVYATHSVRYNRLPGWFICYDLFDKQQNVFVSREILQRLLAGTNIPHVPLVHEGSVGSLDELTAIVSGQSRYDDGRREGIVVRVCEGGKLIARTKLVRADFIAGNERWNRSAKLAVNSLAEDVAFS